MHSTPKTTTHELIDSQIQPDHDVGGPVQIMRQNWAANRTVCAIDALSKRARVMHNSTADRNTLAHLGNTSFWSPFTPKTTRTSIDHFAILADFWDAMPGRNDAIQLKYFSYF